MGGNAFSDQLPEGNFPRLSSTLYQSLRDRLLPTVQKFYTYAAVPAEAPEKTDHGDIDFVVSYENIGSKPDPLAVKSAIGAEAIIADPMGTNNYAVVVEPEEWLKHGGDSDTVSKGKIYCQVDINVSPDKDQWERVLFMHSYGDLGMIMGLIARNAGFHLGSKGLHMSTLEGFPLFLLTTSVVDITSFFGFDMDRWRHGFRTKEDAFEWAASSHYYSPRNLEEPDNRSKKKEKAKRLMYADFRTWSSEKFKDPPRTWTQDEVRTLALQVLGKTEEYNVTLSALETRQTELEARRRQKEKLNGTIVQKWTGLRHLQVKMVMDGVKEKLGGDWENLDSLREDDIKALTLLVAKELGLEVNVSS